ncbi:hypothetical protein JYT28_00670 [Desulfobulbus sp. AH-315-M07]|nr:hypothetical protein [Desulfobulbus sp. AH-315-M07]
MDGKIGVLLGVMAGLVVGVNLARIRKWLEHPVRMVEIGTVRALAMVGGGVKHFAGGMRDHVNEVVNRADGQGALQSPPRPKRASKSRSKRASKSRS